MSENRAKPDQYQLRFPPGMRDELKAAADRRGRSMNAEIVARLEEFPATRERERDLATSFMHAEAERRRLEEMMKLLQGLIEAKEETQEAMRQNIRMMQMLIVMFHDALDQAAAGDMTELNRLIENQKKAPSRDDPFFDEMRELLKQDKK